jgi:protein ATS1
MQFKFGDRSRMPLYALGSNAAYQLSLTHAEDVSTPSITTLCLPPGEFPITIVCGGNHTLLLSNKSSLYVTGSNKYGQCLKPACDVIQGFTKIEGIWQSVAATWEGSIVVDMDGRLWTFGKIKNCENLNGIKWNQGRLPLVSVQGGIQHFVVYDGHRATGFGDGRKGQLSESGGEKEHHFAIPSGKYMREVTCGKDFTCILFNDSISLYTSLTKHNLFPTPTCSNVASIKSSWSTIAVLHHNGTLTSWGRSDHGQLPPSNLPPLSQISGGSEHFIGLSLDKKVFAWGWNEHGNCGLDSREDIAFLHELYFPEGQVPKYVAAGCGTSWIWTEKMGD